jgi:hypothetical protein
VIHRNRPFFDPHFVRSATAHPSVAAPGPAISADMGRWGALLFYPHPHTKRSGKRDGRNGWWVPLTWKMCRHLPAWPGDTVPYTGHVTTGNGEPAHLPLHFLKNTKLRNQGDHHDRHSTIRHERRRRLERHQVRTHLPTRGQFKTLLGGYLAALKRFINREVAPPYRPCMLGPL